MKTVIDVSQFNGAVDWAKAAPHIDGAIIRLGYRGYGAYGSFSLDSAFAANVSGARDSGTPWGVYFLTQAISDAEAEAEARFVDGALRGATPPLGVWLDSEYGEITHQSGRADKLSVRDRTKYALTFLRELQNMGYETGLYCADGWFGSMIDGERIRAAGHKVWLASVENVQPKHRWDAWQYTWCGVLPGIVTPVDVSKWEVAAMGKYYSDTAGHWAESYIDRMREAGIMQGKTATEFAPDAPITRAEVATVLCRLLEKLGM